MGVRVQRLDWVVGDHLGLRFPADGEALAEGGADFLTQAFIAMGALEPDNRVLAVEQLQEVSGGSTGRKFLLAVKYLHPHAHLHSQLFIKFSRDFNNARRDAARVQMTLEVLFALVSTGPVFPIAVPTCYFSDFNESTGTGILITERVAFGEQGLEPLYPKCLDHQMPECLDHYQVLIRTLARLAGSHKAGLLSDKVEAYFPFKPERLVVSHKAPLTPLEIQQKVADLQAFVKQYPNLLPQNLQSQDFFNRLNDEAPRFQLRAKCVNPLLCNNQDMIALCHWNAHVDNAWFWRDKQQELQVGLMDWGNVSQMNVAMAIWGCLSGAEEWLWREELDNLLAVFIAEFKQAGGPSLNFNELKLCLQVYVGSMGLSWMLDAPALIVQHANHLGDATGPKDSIITSSERARSQLSIMTAFLTLWWQSDMNDVINHLAAFD